MKNKIDKIIDSAVKNGEAVGVSCSVFRNGSQVYSGCFGFADKEKKVPMKNDTIVRLFSLSKPVTAVAAMILMERGIISPDDSVSKFIPEFSEISYVENEQVLPCTAEMKISHLLNMTSGLPYADNWGRSVKACGKLFDEIVAGQNGGTELTTSEICRKAAKIPLLFKPGEKWFYGISADVLGGVIEAASGVKFGEFLKKYIFDPLEMNDTGFYVPTEKSERFSTLYSWQENGLAHDYNNYLGLTDYKQPPAFESGGAGLVSTIVDYSKFARMLANKGEFNGVRLLSEKTFRFMTSPQLNDQQLTGIWDKLSGYNYGCLVRVLENPDISQIKTFKGEFGWDGWTGTFFAADPANNITILYFTQVSGAATTRQAKMICNEVYTCL